MVRSSTATKQAQPAEMAKAILSLTVASRQQPTLLLRTPTVLVVLLASNRFWSGVLSLYLGAPASRSSIPLSDALQVLRSCSVCLMLALSWS